MYNPDEMQPTPWSDVSVVQQSMLPPPPPPSAIHNMPPAPAYQPAMPPQYAPPPKPGWGTGRILGVVGLGVVVLGVLIVVGLFALLSFGQSSVNASVPTDAFIGDCFVRGVSTGEPVSCDERHHYEVYSYIEFFDDQYPSRLERLAGADICEEDFERYTGQNYWTSSLDYSIPYPTEEEWNAGDRETVCVLHDAEYHTIRGSKADG